MQPTPNKVSELKKPLFAFVLKVILYEITIWSHIGRRIETPALARQLQISRATSHWLIEVAAELAQDRYASIREAVTDLASNLEFSKLGSKIKDQFAYRSVESSLEGASLGGGYENIVSRER
ncbi:hypothetical protein PRIPAC_75517 [Pristionchus pacificus]|uniref:Uncharacterized protein n=1 Tax=Pristionchus pacificus TaxID=54126 RepID=A0A2A6C089_PRIPA|nr:hypothetical protein PRIPAC_75517 [Pristionchus pacificus]|eukprot:PDM71441.1 hypothetical protein PRIPAC_37848 [Pristionchus pacificus]